MAKASMSKPVETDYGILLRTQPGRQTAGLVTLAGKPRERRLELLRRFRADPKFKNQSTQKQKQRDIFLGCLAVPFIQTS